MSTHEKDDSASPRATLHAAGGTPALPGAGTRALTFAKRAARPLFALLAPAVAVACASELGAQYGASYPLCDAMGSPACGNIGQAGRQGMPGPDTDTRGRTREASRGASSASANQGPLDAITSLPHFEIAATTIAAAGFAATTVAVIIISEWGEGPSTIDVPAPPPPRVTIPPARHPIVVPAPPLPIVVPARPLIEVAAVRVQPRVQNGAQEDECKRDQIERPLVDDDYRPACGNVMTGKGGHKRGRR